MIEYPLNPHRGLPVIVASALRAGYIPAVALCLAACESSIDDSINDLSEGPDERAAARHELILASDKAIEPLIAALESRDDTKARADVADILGDYTSDLTKGERLSIFPA